MEIVNTKNFPQMSKDEVREKFDQAWGKDSIIGIGSTNLQIGYTGEDYGFGRLFTFSGNIIIKGSKDEIFEKLYETAKKTVNMFYAIIPGYAN